MERRLAVLVNQVRSSPVLPCLLFEDEHLLVVNKPPGLNTHAASPYASEGLYDWLRHREPRWARLAIIHRLDKETSGVIVFSKTPLANRSLTEQFAGREVRKKYLLLTDREVDRREFSVKSSLARAGAKYASRPLGAGGDVAETRFRVLVGADVRSLCKMLQAPPSKPQRSSKQQTPMDSTTRDAWSLKLGASLELGAWDLELLKSEPPHVGSYRVVEAEPLTGRTHQIRVHAAENAFPILGDTLYGGTPAARVCLHAAELTLQHPATGEKKIFAVPTDFATKPTGLLRAAVVEPELTNAYRVIHGASDGWPGWYVERLGDYLWSQSEQSLSAAQRAELASLVKTLSARGAWHKHLSRQPRTADAAAGSPLLVLGQKTSERFVIRENGLRFELSLSEGSSVGLFLDQRDNRRRLLTGHVAAGFPLSQMPISDGPLEVLNTFAYTCGFSVCAASGGAQTTSLDLSKKYLDWGKRNFMLNQVDPARHDFIYGDVFDWLRRLMKKRSRFDVVLLDPPTFSQSKESGVFRAGKDYAKLIAAALPLLKSGGVLFASTNAADWAPDRFLMTVEQAIRSAKRKVLQQHYVPQPPDFPVSRAEPAYLKTVWLRIG